MAIMITRRPAIRSLDGWATATLLEAGAIVECEQHGWMQERGDPHALTLAFRVARDDPPRGFSHSEAAAAIADVLRAIGDSCPECSRQGEPE